MSRRRRGRRRAGSTPPGLSELHNVLLPMRGGERRRSIVDVADRLVVTAGVAATVVGHGSGGFLGALVGLAVGVAGAARAMARGRSRRG